MGWAFSTYGEELMCIHSFGGETEGKRLLGRHRTDGRIILRWNFRQWDMRTWIGSM
jgi:hypothetical protein